MFSLLALLASTGRTAAASAGEGAGVPPAPQASTKAQPRSWDVAALPIVYYQPETSLGIGTQVVLVRAASSGGPDGDRHDSVSLAATATRLHQYGAQFSGTKFWNQDHDRMSLDIVAQRFPNKFWGLGNNTPDSAEDEYTPVLGGARLSYSRRVVEKIFAGVTAGGGYLRMASYAPVGSVADYLATRLRQGWLVGIGPNLVRDSRDDSAFPRAGSQTSLTLTAYRQAWLSDYHFVELDADQRTFLALPHRSVLALQAFGQFIVGEPPIDLLPALGGAGMLRGYFQGRYRDKVYVAGQAEWRTPLFWRIGAAVFAAAGNVFPDVEAVSVRYTKTAAGAGLRLNVGRTNPVNIRFDGAVAPGATAIYLTIGEAI
jgi:outer membrane protein assembly factor BamA